MVTPHSSRPSGAVQSGRDEGPERWEESPPEGADRGVPGTSRGTEFPEEGQRFSLRTLYLLLAGLILLGGAVDTWSSFDIAIRAGKHYSSTEPIGWLFTSLIPIYALVPFLRFGYIRARRWMDRPLLAGLIAVGTVVVFSGIHVTVMASLRWVSYPWFGWSYRFASGFEEFFTEFRKDVLACVVICAVFYLNERGAGSGTTATAGDTGAAELWLRDGAARIRVQPSEVLWVASAGNYVEYVLAGGRKHLIRGTLTGEAVRLAAFGIVRVHRTRLVNLKRMVAVTPRDSGDVDVQLDSGDRVICSRNYRDQLPESLRG
jgi:hypothetical protein